MLLSPESGKLVGQRQNNPSENCKVYLEISGSSIARTQDGKGGKEAWMIPRFVV